MAGSSLAMPGPNMQPKAIAELMEGEKVTLAAGVPTIWMGVLPELEGRDLSSLREILCGGSAVPRSLSEAYREKIGVPMTQGWGMTETSPLGSVSYIKSTMRDRSEEELAGLRALQGLPSSLSGSAMRISTSGDGRPCSARRPASSSSERSRMVLLM